MKLSSGSPAHKITRILIIEDQVSMREMLAELLSQGSEFEVVGQAATLTEALEVAHATQPDVIILDWVFPGGGGRVFMREMRSHRLSGHVLVLSGNTSEDTVREALLAGARGFFEKGASLKEFLGALRTVAVGGAYFGPVVAGIVQRLVSRPPLGQEKSAEPPNSAAPMAGGVAALDPATATAG